MFIHLVIMTDPEGEDTYTAFTDLGQAEDHMAEMADSGEYGEGTWAEQTQWFSDDDWTIELHAIEVIRP